MTAGMLTGSLWRNAECKRFPSEARLLAVFWHFSSVLGLWVVSDEHGQEQEDSLRRARRSASYSTLEF